MKEEEQLQREENPMGKARFSLSASLDEFIAGTTDDISEVFAWMGIAMEHFLEGEGHQINQIGAVCLCDAWRGGSPLQSLGKKSQST